MDDCLFDSRYLFDLHVHTSLDIRLLRNKYKRTNNNEIASNDLLECFMKSWIMINQSCYHSWYWFYLHLPLLSNARCARSYHIEQSSQLAHRLSLTILNKMFRSNDDVGRSLNNWYWSQLFKNNLESFNVCFKISSWLGLNFALSVLSIHYWFK